MENINRKKRLDLEEQERKKQVFGIAEGGSLKTYYTTDEKGQKYTKQQPFNIKDRDDSKIWALKEELENDFSQKYTFKPNTLEGINKHLIMEVLNED